MYQWENSGPTPLDLATPLAQGLALGGEAAARSEKVRSDIANESQMRAALGLEQQKQNFQESVYNAGGAMRAAQLTMATAGANQATQQANLNASGAPILSDFVTSLDQETDPKKINDMSIPGGLSDSQQQQATQALVTKRHTLGASILADSASKTALNNTTIEAQATENGIDINQPQYQNADGSPNYTAIGAANQAHAATLADTAEKRLESRDTNKQIAIGVRQNDYLNTKSQLEALSPKMSDIDKLTFTQAKAKVDGAIRAKSMLISPTPENTAPYNQEIDEGQMDLETLKRKYNASTMAPATGAPAPTSAPSQQPTKIKVNPSTGERIGLINGQWVPLK